MDTAIGNVTACRAFVKSKKRMLNGAPCRRRVPVCVFLVPRLLVVSVIVGVSAAKGAPRIVFVELSWNIRCSRGEYELRRHERDLDLVRHTGMRGCG